MRVGMGRRLVKAMGRGTCQTAPNGAEPAERPVETAGSLTIAFEDPAGRVRSVVYGVQHEGLADEEEEDEGAVCPEDTAL